MYTIRGADLKEYGPVDASTLRQWLAQGRLNGGTMVRLEGTTEWTVLSKLSEFAHDLGPALAPPAPLAPALPRPMETPKTSGLAIASLVLGLLGLCSGGITALVGLVLGIVALVKINKDPARLKGQGMAIAGICVSALLLLALPALLLPALARAKSKAQTINCMNNLKQLGLGMRIYAVDHNDKLPLAANWCDEILSSVGSDKVFKCAGAKGTARCSYAFNARLGGLDQAKISPSTVLLFECKGGWNVSGGPSAMVSHHFETYTICFADGSVRQMPSHQLSRLRWEP